MISNSFTYRFKMTYPGSSMVKDEFRWIHKLIFDTNLWKPFLIWIFEPKLWPISDRNSLTKCPPRFTILDLRKISDLNLSYWLAFDQSPSWLPFSINALSMWNVWKFIWTTREITILLGTIHRKIIRSWKLVSKCLVLKSRFARRIHFITWCYHRDFHKEWKAFLWLPQSQVLELRNHHPLRRPSTFHYCL